MSDSEQTELKAGHPPAMKVGGKRVPLPKHHDEKQEAPKVDNQEEDKDKSNASKTVVISGAQVKDKDVYSVEATRAIHEKPVPTHSNYDGGHHASGPHGNKQNFIQQPRKQ